MASLRDKTISGFFWSFLQKVGGKGIQFITIIILARLLTPEDFGLIGMLTIFITVSQNIVQAGFSEALIQKKKTDDEDFSSVFWINLLVSIILYGILFIAAPFIADFYDQPLLTSMTRVLSLIFIISSFSYVQQAKLRKEMKFKTLMFIHIPSIIIAGIVAVTMAFLDYGVWSIIGMQITMSIAYAIQIWIYSKWKPLFSFNKQKARGLFSFGSRLMISSILNTLFKESYTVIIGKFFPVAILGFYTNAEKLVKTPAYTLSGALKNVTFSAFSTIQDDNKRLKSGYKKMIQQMVFIICPIFVLAAVIAPALFSLILTDKWLPAVPYFRILVVFGIFAPLNSYNLDIVNIKGRSDLFLKLNIIKKIIVVIGIACTLPFGIWPLVVFRACSAIINYIINSHFSGKFINYPLKEQLNDIFPIFLLTIGVSSLVALVNVQVTGYSNWYSLLLGLGGGLLYWLVAKFINFPPYKEIENILRPRLKSLGKGF